MHTARETEHAEDGLRRIAAGFATLGLLAACSGGTTEPATPANSSAPSAVDPSLKVPAPLATDQLLDSPCDVLTAAETAQVGLAYPGRKSTDVLTSCQWTSSGSRENFVGISALPQNKGGISDIYDQKSSQAYFQPVTIDGYPGVFASKADGRPSGNCVLWVGATDQLAFSVNPQIGTGHNKANPCGLAQQIATVVITHLKAQD
ncbi:DUF3558 domain-containing protein [Amycolatopsis rhabdoformis]|uniref:DUF3558 domain-containing protein n=1 Tax=Amycolatopsis rhabdoformis TaxID=1448059 RepID=A0ABZ1I1R4_9PSEU|nr:DUF3558 domain-containing protein [Amycolatopsis rhabdoformis]WSE28319.1 DUF3558 domain-containing protein [Amycolatopsis rhabdoformis]